MWSWANVVCALRARRSFIFSWMKVHFFPCSEQIIESPWMDHEIIFLHSRCCCCCCWINSKVIREIIMLARKFHSPILSHRTLIQVVTAHTQPKLYFFCLIRNQHIFAWQIQQWSPARHSSVPKARNKFWRAVWHVNSRFAEFNSHCARIHGAHSLITTLNP